MTISVVIPAYNEEKYLPATLASIKQLDRQPDEVIVVDGGSTDKTANLAKSAGVKVIVVAHRGIGFARQKGLEAAKGDIVAYTDADTIVPKDWLTKIEATLSQPDTVATYGNYKVPDGWFVYRYFINYLNPLFFSLMAFLGAPAAGGQNIAFVRKTGLAAGGFPVDFKSVEDFEMMRRMKQFGKAVYRKDNCVTSSGRRGNEGLAMIPRTLIGTFRYYLTRKADKFSFPDFR